MQFQQNQADLDYLLNRASEFLGEPVRPLTLSHEMAFHLHRNARVEDVGGLGLSQPVRMFNSGSHGHPVMMGMERYVVTLGETEGHRRLSLVRVVNPFAAGYPPNLLGELWVAPATDYLRLYRWLRRAAKREVEEIAPVMQADEQKRLVDNTIGFLQRGEEALKRFGIPLKRGVLLIGTPGNGKTMACRWLHAQAMKLGLEWRTVSAEDYDMARSGGSAHMLFDLTEPGIVLFDDFDTGLRNREDTGGAGDQSMFLSELDGMEIHRGVVYLFTTNAKLKDLDPAFRRPGRIDQIIRFPYPDADLRRRLIVEHWPQEVVENVPVEEIVNATEERSFAEVDELKKLLVMRFLDEDEWNWEWAWEAFQNSATHDEQDRSLGFTPRRNLRNGRSRVSPGWQDDEIPF